jgi:hypothetical protein
MRVTELSGPSSTFGSYRKLMEKLVRCIKRNCWKAQLKTERKELHSTWPVKKAIKIFSGFLYSSLAAKTKDFENKKSAIEKYLLQLDNEDYYYTAIVYYFRHCDDSFDLLNAIQRDFGSGFVKNLFTLKMIDEQNLLHGICQSDSGNVSKIFTFLLECFSNDPEFLKQLFLSRASDGQSFLSFAFHYLKNEKLLELLEELEKLKSNPEFGQDFVKKLVLMGSGREYGVFIFCYARSKYFDDDLFLEVLKQLKFLCGEETL